MNSGPLFCDVCRQQYNERGRSYSNPSSVLSRDSLFVSVLKNASEHFIFFYFQFKTRKSNLLFIQMTRLQCPKSILCIGPSICTDVQHLQRWTQESNRMFDVLVYLLHCVV